MPFIKPKIINKTYKNVDPIELSTAMEAKYDCYLDEAEAIPKRFGHQSFCEIEGVGSIDGVYFWEEKDWVIAIANGTPYKIESDGTISAIATTDYLLSNFPVSFAVENNRQYLCAANGTRILKMDGANANYLSSSDAPTKSTHIDFLDTYVLSNNGDATFLWSDTGDIDTWNPLNFASVEGASDIVNSLVVEQERIHVFGPRSLEVWWNDSTNPFSRVSQGLINHGCIAPFSVVKANNTVYWLANDKRFVKRQGTAVVSVSTAFDRELQKLKKVDDAFSIYMTPHGKTFIILIFPTENKSYFYDFAREDWGEISYLDNVNNIRERWIGNSYCFAKSWNKHLVGSRKDGKLYEISEDFDDDDGRQIAYEFITGNINYDTERRKRSRRLTIKCKCGDQDNGNLLFSFKDNNDNKWSTERAISLKGKGNTNFLIELKGLGIYQNRKYRIRLTDSCNFVFVGMEEELEVLPW